MIRESELDRLRRCLERAFPSGGTRADLRPFCGRIYATADVTFDAFEGGETLPGDALRVETIAFPADDPAVAQLRTLLRADTDGAVADVLDELAALHSEQPLTVEQLRTMAQARRAR
jgi:hypothetical protein